MNYEVICVRDTNIEMPGAKFTMFITSTANMRSFLTRGEVAHGTRTAFVSRLNKTVHNDHKNMIKVEKDS